MPKKKAPAQSDTSRSTQSTKSTGSQFANQSPASSKNSQSSSGLTGLIDTIAQKFSSASTDSSISKSSSDVIMGGLDGQAESPDLLTSPDTASGFSLSPKGQPDVLKKKHPVQKPDLDKKQRPGISKKKGKGKGVGKAQYIAMNKVIATTKLATKEILAMTELGGTRFGYMANRWTAPVLDPNSVEYPNVDTVVRVVAGDTYDSALEMQNAGSTTDHMPVCVLNFANAYKPGGGWLNGARAQEEQLCYRSTLIGTLHTRFYPMDDLECLYSPKVIVFRNSVDNGYSFISGGEELHLSPTVSVISMAARSQPELTPDESTYVDVHHRYLMIAKMELILRTAANNNHRRLILGALGCGAFHHPTQEVADCWYEVLMNKEFKGWFEQIYFAIRDSPKEDNVEIFKETLDGLIL
ncbi:hypothetical protein N7536_003312 [Penicillium majusculum]|uniref:Microbial-type PARG catalytic domain-containing protein n=1 Tax=Penicillium solitum TaxID=60172 RepID=A0A1V6R0F5_9EURO|nr:uncharacterized protein PENSOL_c023G09068 [Penicillium solitum]KAJ5700299.1 hypothetical protein N7536_003312 [Penicillium majusculum]OQD94938.1 hypothetical protein PENSOL_c023G09068 [Penicillium solitum]